MMPPQFQISLCFSRITPSSGSSSELASNEFYHSPDDVVEKGVSMFTALRNRARDDHHLYLESTAAHPGRGAEAAQTGVLENPNQRAQVSSQENDALGSIVKSNSFDESRSEPRNAFAGGTHLCTSNPESAARAQSLNSSPRASPPHSSYRAWKFRIFSEGRASARPNLTLLPSALAAEVDLGRDFAALRVHSRMFGVTGHSDKYVR